MSQFYTILANTVFITHITFGAWLLCGWFFPQFKIMYLVSLGGWMGSWIILRVCPLTVIEFWLRNKAGEVRDINNEFIQFYAKKFFDIEISTPSVFLSGAVVFIGLVILSLGKT